jgi:arabinogalactan oligomer / maltooligosaccharide transport system substrate-binding protein
MRRYLTALLAVAALVLTACGGETTPEPDEPDTTDTETESEEPEEDDADADADAAEEGEEEQAETIERADADLVIWTDESRTPIIQAIGDQFAEDEGISVAVQQLDFGDIRDSLITQGPAGEGPDVIIGANDWLGQLVTNGAIDPIELGDDADRFVDVSLEAFTYEGQIYGLPYAVENVALYRNTELAPEAPASFDDMIDTGLALVDAGDADLPLSLQVGADGDPYHFYPLFTSFGTSVFAFGDDGYDPDELLIDSDEGLAFAEALDDLRERGALSADVTFDIALEAFVDGRSPFAIGGPWNIEAADGGGFDYVVEEIPSLGGDVARPFVGVQGFMISAYAENPLIATDFVLNYLGTEDVALQLFETGQRPPALISAAEQVGDDPVIAGFSAVGEAGQSLPNIPAMSAVWADWGQAQRDILLGTDDPSERMRQAGELIREQLAS